jgi:general stress protein 26
MPALTLPADVVAVFHNFRTAEFTTLAKDGTPITWPVTALYEEASGTFVTATAIGLPQKAYNIRRNPRVALLFSEPRASGLAGAPAVLVQGLAQVADDITSVAGLEGLWEKIYRFQPPSKVTSSNALMRYLMDWYYMRLKIVTTPQRVLWWAQGDFSRAPQEAGHVG